MADGTAEPGWEAVASLLDEQVAAAGRGGAAVAVHHRGRPVVDVWTGSRDDRGTPWERDTIAMSFSTTKGVASTALHMCVDRGQIDYDDPVSKHWPEFGQSGKEAITVRQILCHESGLFRLGDIIDADGDGRELLDWDGMIGRLETMRPAFEPGTANAYQAVTFGHLVGELVSRVSGVGFAEFVRHEIAEPLGLDGCCVGLPASELPRVAKLLPAPTDSAGPLDFAALEQLGASLGVEVHPELIVAAIPPAMTRLGFGPEVLAVPMPAFNGCFTARSLARLYACLAAGGELDGVRLLSAETIVRAIEVQNDRPDLVIMFPMNWRLGYHEVVTSAGVLAHGFGHNGLGGSGAFADPDRDLSVALTLNALGSNLALDERFIELGGQAVRAADAA